MTIVPIDAIIALSSCKEKYADVFNKLKKQGFEFLAEDTFLGCVEHIKKKIEYYKSLSNEHPEVTDMVTNIITELNNFINDVNVLFGLAKQELKK